MTDNQVKVAASSPLQEAFSAKTDPFALFENWLETAWQSEINDANAMSLATPGNDGFPNLRVVLLKGVEEGCFVFFTNFGSVKAQELDITPKAAICLHWKSLRRQFRARGSIKRASSAQSDAYFATRPRQSQIGAWASRQSSLLESREVFESRIARYQERFADTDIPRPPYWGGYCLCPHEMEFWCDRPYRLHDRLRFSRKSTMDEWHKERLFP